LDKIPEEQRTRHKEQILVNDIHPVELKKKIDNTDKVFGDLMDANSIVKK